MYAWWSGLEPQVKGAFISGFFTLIAAVGGVLVVAWQIRKQGENAIKANRHNESLKLRKEIYEQISSKVITAQNAYDDLWNFLSKVRHAAADFANGQTLDSTEINVKALDKLTDTVATARYELAMLAETWDVIDPRLEVFFVFKLAASIKFDEAEAQYRKEVGPYLAEVGRWRRDPDAVTGTGKVTDPWQAAIWKYQDHIRDYDRAMQRLLLGEIFDLKKLKREASEEDEDPPITLENADEMMKKVPEIDVESPVFRRHLN